MPSVKKFLLERIKNAGIDTVFSVPGDYALGMAKAFEDDPEITLVGSTDESHAGFAADAYARVHGFGCVCVTYNVALKCMNPIAGAFAEKSPVVLITGSPGLKERDEPFLLHHTVGTYDTQREIFARITCANTVLSDPATAAYEIDRVIEAMKHHRQPVYIEIPRDVADKPVSYDIDQGTPKSPTSDPINLDDAVHEVSQWIMAARDPVIVAGVELSRFGFNDALVHFAERTNIPMFTEALSKSTVGERHPLFGGVYCGAASPDPVRKMVDNSDCILMLGVMLTDLMIGSAKPAFASRQTVRANIDQSLKVRNHEYTDIVFQEFCAALFEKYVNIAKKPAPAVYKKPAKRKFVAQDKPITTKRFFEKVDAMIDKNSAIVTDIGDVLFGALELTVDHVNSFISPAYYTSMGNAIPASLGVCLAKPGTRPIVLVGDGAFQMSLSEISNLVRYKLNPIIFVLNNRGYTTERFILEGKFNDIADWNYHKVAEVFGGQGYKVTTEQELEDAVAQAQGSDQVSVINVLVGTRDVSTALERVASSLSKKVLMSRMMCSECPFRREPRVNAGWAERLNGNLYPCHMIPENDSTDPDHVCIGSELNRLILTHYKETDAEVQQEHPQSPATPADQSPDQDLPRSRGARR